MSEFEVLQFEAPKENSNYIKVIGVGGGGTNAVNHMFNQGIKGVDFIVCNTDAKSLNSSPIQNKIKIGSDGLGAGNKPIVGETAALAAEDKIKSALQNTQMLFITAGMGGGTGTGAAPVIAKFAKEMDFYNEEGEKTNDKILVVAIVTLPFHFEGKRRKEQAEEGIKKLKEIVDAIIIVNTDKIRTKGNLPLPKLFPMADNVLLTASKGIAEIITLENSYIHVDFRDVQEVMVNSGVALMGIGSAYGSGVERAQEAIEMAASSELLNDCDIKGTKNILLYITTSPEEEYAITYDEQEAIADFIKAQTDDEPDIIWGIGYDESFKDRLDITLIATGFEAKEIYNPYELTQRPTPKTLDEVIEKKPEAKIETPIIETQPIDSFKDFQIINRNTEAQKEVIIESKSEVREEIKVIAESKPLVHVLDMNDFSFAGSEMAQNKVVSPIASQYKPKEFEHEIALKEEFEENKNNFEIKIIETKPEQPKPEERKPVETPQEDVDKHSRTVRERQKRMELFAKLLKEKDGLEKVITTPAYEQYGIDISQPSQAYSEQEASKISFESGGIKINNSYLHDNPD